MTFLSRIIKFENTILEDGKVELYIKEEEPIPEEITIINSLNQDSAVSIDEDIGELLEKAKKRAEKSAAKILEEAYSKRDGIVNLATEEAKRLKSQAVLAGRNEGMAQASKDVAGTLAEMNKVLERIQETIISNDERIRKEIISLSLEIASRIMAKRIEEDENEMTELVKEAVRTEKDKKNINIYIVKEMRGFIDHLDREMEPIRESYQSQIRIKPAELPEGGVRVETEEGIIDASVFVQLDNLKRQLQILDSES